MTDHICGYVGSKTGSPCKRSVPSEGMRCPNHPRTFGNERAERWRDYSNVKEEREAKEERLVTDGGRPIPEVCGAGFTFSGPGDELRRCPECGTANNMFVNPSECYECGREWGSGGEVMDDGRDDGAEILKGGDEA